MQNPPASTLGRRVEPHDPLYPTLATGFNQRFVGAPRYVQVCATAEQVREAVQAARTHEPPLRITVRSGGHCYEGFVTSGNAGVIIDISPLNRVYQQEGEYCVEAGCALWTVYNTLAREYGVTLPAGSCYSVGAGGHILGGGYGLLAREYGLTVDWLSAVELVRVRADNTVEIIRVGRDSTGEEADIFWGHLGGGGGNFGIVTRYFFQQLPPTPASAFLATMAWDWPATPAERLAFKPVFTAIVEQYGRFFAAHSAPDSPYRQLFALLHLNHYQVGQLTLTVQYTGMQTELVDHFLAEMAAAGGEPVAQRVMSGPYPPVPHTESGRRMPWLEATQTLNGSGANQRGKYKSAYMRKPFPARQLEVLWHYLGELPCPTSQALVQVDSYGGVVNQVAPAATAVPQRSSILKLQYQLYWPDAAQDTECLTWLWELYEAMYGPHGPSPDDVLDGCYVNYPDVDLANWQYLYYKDNYARLQRSKRAADPLNVFHHAQAIELPAASGVKARQAL